MTKKQKMIMEKRIVEMLDLSNTFGTDREALHSCADDLLLSSLRDLGFGELADAYDKLSSVGFWYA